MLIYDIKCMSLDKPDEWVCFEDTEHSMRYAFKHWMAERIYRKIFKQYYDFKKMHNVLLQETDCLIEALEFINLQIHFQLLCLAEMDLIYRNQLSKDFE